ncbi:transglutaminase-like domain-containing protein [Pontiellaceae bacterium B12219]|nr:transglutaminase-like domain-containing protein [Pontiellaceae bacterium B12219]
MAGHNQEADVMEEPVSKHWKPGEMRSLNGDERISFTVLTLYLFIFCACTYLFWPSLSLKIIGGTAALLGIMLFTTALLNKGTLPRKHSKYTVKWYLISFFTGLVVLMGLRVVARNVEDYKIATMIIFGSLSLLLVVFRKTIIQILMAFLALTFISVTVANWNAAVSGQMSFLDTLGKCGRTIFQIQPIEDVANTLIAGNYMGYLNKVDYRDEQLNMLAVRKVRGAGDDDLQKALILLNFVSNDIFYVSDPDDGKEYAKDPLNTLISGGGDCEDQSVLLCSLLESVGVNTFMGFTSDHVFSMATFRGRYKELDGVPYVLINGQRGYMLDAADPNAKIGYGAAAPQQIERIFDVRTKAMVKFSLPSAK